MNKTFKYLTKSTRYYFIVSLKVLDSLLLLLREIAKSSHILSLLEKKNLVAELIFMDSPIDYSKHKVYIYSLI